MKLTERIDEVHSVLVGLPWLLRNRAVIAALAKEVNDRDAYIKQLHQLIEVSVDLGWHTEIAELMNEAPKPKEYEQ